VNHTRSANEGVRSPRCHGRCSELQTLSWQVKSAIQEFCIANLRDDYLEVYRGARPDGKYQETKVLQRGQSTDIVALPGVIIAVDELL
jgi:hypothetical protein